MPLDWPILWLYFLEIGSTFLSAKRLGAKIRVVGEPGFLILPKKIKIRNEVSKLLKILLSCQVPAMKSISLKSSKQAHISEG
jgi:hypothetical protein